MMATLDGQINPRTWKGPRPPQLNEAILQAESSPDKNGLTEKAYEENVWKLVNGREGLPKEGLSVKVHAKEAQLDEVRTVCTDGAKAGESAGALHFGGCYVVIILSEKSTTIGSRRQSCTAAEHDDWMARLTKEAKEAHSGHTEAFFFVQKQDQHIDIPIQASQQDLVRKGIEKLEANGGMEIPYYAKPDDSDS